MYNVYKNVLTLVWHDIYKETLHEKDEIKG